MVPTFRTILAAIVLLSATLPPLSSKAAGDATKGKAHYALCQTCHGQNGEGNQATNAPRLAGQHDWYLLRQLNYFRAGVRGAHPQDSFGQQMATMANTLRNEQAVVDVVAYIGTLDAPPSPRSETRGDPDRGEQRYSPCIFCHGTKGQGFKETNSPRLAGQHDWYLVRQLENFKARVRGAHENDKPGRLMRAMAMAALHDDQAIRDVAAYIHTLK